MKRPARMPQAAIEMNIVVNAACWNAEPGAEETVRRAVSDAARLAATQGKIGTGIGGALSVVLTDDAEIRALNRDWRDLDKPTNVLSFPAAPAPGAPRGTAMLGDVVIAYETARREAAEEGKPFAHHLSHLAVHGFLHLIGHDHDTEAKAKAMEELERKALAGLGIPDPYENA